MILLPYGHEQTTVRRLPWITLSLLGLCLAAFVLSGRANPLPEEDLRIQRDASATVEYYTEHPYLELDEEFKQTLLVGEDDEEFEAVLESFAESRQPKPIGRALAAEQDELDKLAARAVDGFRHHTLRRWGLIPNGGHPLGWLTHMFLHAGWLHLIGNLLILFLAAPFIEDVWGRPLFLGFYLASGLVAAGFHVLSDPTGNVPMIGASGAIAGVMGAFLIRYGTTRIKFFYFFLLIRGTFRAPAWLMIPVWFVSQVWMGLLTSELDVRGGVAHWAHVGGFVAGVVVAWFVRAKRIEERFVDARIEQKITLEVEDNREVVEALSLRESDPEQSFRLLTLAVMNQPRNHDGAAALWELARELDRTSEAAPLVLRSIGHQLRADDAELALQQWIEVLAQEPQVHGDPRLFVRLAQELLSRDDRDSARVTLRLALPSAGARVAPALGLNIARLACEIDPPTARAAALQLLSQTDLEPDTRRRAEQLLGGLPPDLQTVPLSGGG